MKVILIGYRACGKSTVGTMLSAMLKIPFWDTDALVEKKEGMPIRQIVERRGWDYFRALERETILSLPGQEAAVVATGGGVVLAGENMDALKQMGKVFWLHAPLNDILDRLKEDAAAKAQRPQFTSAGLAEETKATWESRLPLYESAADFIVRTEGRGAPEVARQIYDYLQTSGMIAGAT